MKEFKKSLKHVVLVQIICWLIFILIDENKFTSQSTAEDISVIAGIVIQLIVLVIYFIFAKKIIKKNNLDPVKYNVSLFFVWNAISILNAAVFLYLVDHRYLHLCDETTTTAFFGPCFLNGIEYGVNWFFMVALSILILLISIIIACYKAIIKKLQKA